jgi:hypothetical protein
MISATYCHCHEIPGLGHCNWIVGVVLLALFPIWHVIGLVVSRQQRGMDQ